MCLNLTFSCLDFLTCLNFTFSCLDFLTLEVTNDNFHGVHCLELNLREFKKNHCIANTGRKNIDTIVLLNRPFITISQ